MAPEALPPNPLPPRAVANDISLLLTSKATRLRNTALFRNNLSSPSTSTSKPSPHTTTEDSAFIPGGQNSGIGYVPSSSDKDKASDAATATLRNKLLGKRKGRGGESGPGGRRGGAESEEDEDEGRSGLGKRKKAKKVRRDEEDEEVVDVAASEDTPALEAPGEVAKKVVEEDDQPATTVSTEDNRSGQTEGSKPKKRKKKSKNKNKKD